MDHAATSTGGNVDTECTRDYASDFKTTRTFKSKEDLKKWAREIGRLNDFVIVTLRSDSGEGNKRPRFTLGCERSGKCDRRSTPKKTMTDDEYGRQHTGTKKCGCPFRLMGKKQAAGDEWELMVVVGWHNHALGHLEEGHSFAGKLSQEEKSLLKGMSERGVQPKEMLTTLKQRDEHNKSTRRTIYNGCQRLRVLRKLEDDSLKKLEDYSFRLQRFMCKASEYNYMEKHRLNPKTDTVLEFFLTHPTSLELLSAFPRVLGIGYVYRGVKMMLLNIFGITSTNIKFFVAFAWLSSKHESGCGWALSTLRGAMDDEGVPMPDVIILAEVKEVDLMKAIDDVFSPAKVLFSILSINEHVKSYCWRIFNVNVMGWNSFKGKRNLLVKSPTEAEFEQQLMQLRTEFSMYPEALAYVTDTLLKPYKEKFVAAWTDNIMHFGHTYILNWDPVYWKLCFTYSTYCEGSAVIEQTKIDTFWKDLYTSHENNHADIKVSFVESSTNEYKKFENPEFRELRGVVSIFALKKILGQTKLIDEKDTYHSVCSCAIKRTHGLPCAHEIARYKREGRPIPLDCIHPHWKKLDLEPLTRTAESGVDKRMKRRRLSKNMNNSTPSAPHLSEIVESQQRNSPNAGLSIVHSKQERQPEAEDKVCDIQPTKQLEFVDVCPLVLRPYILDVKDVARDGHCGFRAVASFMGYSDEVGWLIVREELRNELKFNSAHYAQLFDSYQRVYELLDALAYSESTCPEKKHWMTMPDMGHIIASCYKVVLMHLSSVQCFTFFPLRIAPIYAPKEVAIGFVNEHFVQVFLIPGHPMPPTVPALTKKYKNMPHDEEPVLERIHQQCFKEWATPYNGRMDNFKSLQPKVVVSQENPTVLDIDLVPSVDNMDAFFGSLQFPGAAASTSRRDVDTGCTRDYTSEFKMTQIFKSRKDLIEWACTVGRSNGFVIVTLRSDSGERKKRARVTLGCERSGEPDPRKEIKNKDRRQTGTKKCGCPFRLMGTKKLGTDDDWVLIVVEGVHNHAVGHLEEGHSFAGRLSQEEKSLLKDMTERLVQPKEILTTLKRKDKHNKSTLRTIYNARQLWKAGSEKFDMQQWMSRLSKLSKYNHIIQWQRTCPKTDTRDFFLTHPTSLDLLRAFPCVLKIGSMRVFETDCQLNIVGVTSTSMIFSVAYVYLSSQGRNNFLWALNTLRGVMDGFAMPRVIVTNINLGLIRAIEDVFGTTQVLLNRRNLYWNVVYNCVERLLDSNDRREYFLSKWKILVESPTIAEFEQELMQLRIDFSMCPESLEYVTNTLLNPFKEKFVAAWRNKYMHFGTSTSDVLENFTDFQEQLMDPFWNLPMQGDRRVLPDEEEFDDLLEEMHYALESEHIKIKASFKKCLAAVEIDDFRIPELKELVGVVSTSALTLVLAQCRKACDVINVECSECSCVIRRTHGLPCLHEIAKYKRDGRPIPVECIDPHWKKLSMPPLRNTAESGVDETMKRRRLNKNDASTPSALSLFEVAESAEGNSLELEEKVYRKQSTKPLEFVDAFPAILRLYILDVKDVASDGHCGFRAIASLLGNSDEDGWVKVRKDLINELKFNAAHYAQLYRSDQRVYELLHALNYFGSTCLDHKEHWMTMPDMGHIIASCYNVIFMHLSSVQCFTFFPLRTAPISASSRIEIAIGFVNEHFVQVFLEPGHPMPPITPAPTKKWKNMPLVATDWERFHEQRCTEWASPYIARIDNFKSLQPEAVLQKNPIVIDTDSLPSLENMDDFFDYVASDQTPTWSNHNSIL